MNVVYNIQELEQTIKDLARITNASITIYNLDFLPIVSSQNVYYFCRLVHSCAAYAPRLCDCYSISHFEKCKVTGQPVEHLCHMGLWGVVFPIKHNDLVLGYLQFGNARQNNTFEEISSPDWLTDSERALLSANFGDVMFYDKEQTESLIRIISSIIKQIILSGSAHIQKDSLAESFANYVRENLTGDLSINSLCQNLHVSRNKLYKAVENVFGCPVTDYIRRMRLQKALLLLRETDLRITEIAEICGFPDTIRLDIIMRKYNGTTPRQYRKDNQSKTNTYSAK